MVVPRGATVPSCGTASVGVQFDAARSGFGGAVCAGGVAGAGGACAKTAVGSSTSAQPMALESFIVMEDKRRRGADVPGTIPKSGNRFSDQIMPNNKMRRV